ncbi:hypothetical protein AB6A40_004414 [Gnathostoma spinigerum]|uniref:Uncharacterized protein n=1 Tax=Gnathostoma spinigerum TaxID=75299 RepID=A0ABD6ECF3_9BILA
MFISPVHLVFLVGVVSVCAEDLDEDLKLPKDPLVGPDGEEFKDGEVVDCEFIEKQGGFYLNKTASSLYEGSLAAQPPCNPAMKSIRDYYKGFASLNNFPSPFTSSLTKDPLTGSEFHFFVKDAVNK